MNKQLLVHETTITIEELGASSLQSANQAEAAAHGAQQALNYAADGTRTSWLYD